MMKIIATINKILNRYRSIIQLMKKVIFILIVVFLGAFAIMFFEPGYGNIKHFFDAIWWALVTITTVGYGDLYPVTFWGRIIGIIFIFLGFIIFSTFTAFIASSFIDQKIKERKGLNKVKLRNHFMLCGWNNSSRKILDFLMENQDKNLPPIVLINELEEADISVIKNHYESIDIRFIRGDFTNQEILNRANVTEAAQIILMYDKSKPDSSPSDERTIIAAHNILYLKPKGKINLQLKEGKYLPNIQREKISNVVIYGDVGGNLLANSTLNPSVPIFIQELLKHRKGVGFKEQNIPNEFVGSTYLELFDYFREKKNLILLGIVTVQPEFSIDDILSDDTSNIDNFIKHQFELSGKKFSVRSDTSNVKIKPNDDYIILDTDKAIVM
ncbi:MAG: potassium channel protein [Candidatus Cloacimonetes bacterium]|nr:potassium channel protein [Candidatus Cloacimonadota bacterium]